MNYPLNIENFDLGSYAVANSEDEHKALSLLGFKPAYVEAEVETVSVDSVESLRLQLDARGIAYDNRLGVAKLTALLSV